MSEDGFSDCLEEPNMEIQIKTLMGTMFDIKVSASDTVGDIKKKIYRVEGIPVYQQNLIFRSKELNDTSQLADVGIKDGSVLTLVTLMRGGPISTRRLAVSCEHHVMLKELKELLENTREEISPGSKVSVLVFKEGDIINLLRVIENEDGSYSPYSEKPISPPSKSTRKEALKTCAAGFERSLEDAEMCTKISSLRKKMNELSIRRQQSKNKEGNEMEDKLFGEASLCNKQEKPTTSEMSFKFLTECANDLLDKLDLTIYERSLDEGNPAECEEIALKDKHRTKQVRLPKTNSAYSENKGSYSLTKQSYARMHKKRESKLNESNSRDRIIGGSPLLDRKMDSSLAEQFAVLEEDDQDLYSEAISVPTRNRVHLTQLVLSEGSERPKSTSDSLELQENAQDLWEIHESPSERLKHSATCKFGLLKRRQNVEYGYDSLENTSPNTVKPEVSANYSKNSEFGGVCSGNFYSLPQFVSSPSAIPPQYAPKRDEYCDYFFSNNSRSPLYGRKTSTEKEEEIFKPDTFSLLGECSTIQRLKNDDDIRDDDDDAINDVFGYYNLGCLEFPLKPDAVGKMERSVVKLPPVLKKKSRCSECNKRLNITNIYNCRCGKIFCSQHRYSETHGCNYDYKSEGRKILERQNPLVAAEKVKRF